MVFVFSFKIMTTENRKEYFKKYYLKNKDKYTQRSKDYSKTEKRKKYLKEYKKLYKRKNRKSKQSIAWAKIKYLIDSKKINRKCCQICGETKTHYHHLVFELCEKHHKEAHQNKNLLINLSPFDFSNLATFKGRNV
jgi:5-methylcytosine-specific restriction endonuclease McrA